MTEEGGVRRKGSGRKSQVVAGWGSPDWVCELARGQMDHGEGASSRSLERLPDGWIVKSRRRKDGRVDRVIPLSLARSYPQSASVFFFSMRPCPWYISCAGIKKTCKQEEEMERSAFHF